MQCVNGLMYMLADLSPFGVTGNKRIPLDIRNAVNNVEMLLGRRLTNFGEDERSVLPDDFCPDHKYFRMKPDFWRRS